MGILLYSDFSVFSGMDALVQIDPDKKASLYFTSGSQCITFSFFRQNRKFDYFSDILYFLFIVFLSKKAYHPIIKRNYNFNNCSY